MFYGILWITKCLKTSFVLSVRLCSVHLVLITNKPFWMNSVAFFMWPDHHEAIDETQSLSFISFVHWHSIFTYLLRYFGNDVKKLWEFWKAETRFTSSVLYRIELKTAAIMKKLPVKENELVCKIYFNS